MNYGIYRQFGEYKCWFQKTFDFAHGYGYHVHITNKRFDRGYGFSKNKFTAVRMALTKVKQK